MQSASEAMQRLTFKELRNGNYEAEIAEVKQLPLHEQDQWLSECFDDGPPFNTSLSCQLFHLPDFMKKITVEDTKPSEFDPLKDERKFSPIIKCVYFLLCCNFC